MNSKHQEISSHDVVVIQHRDNTPSGKVSNSTTIKIRTLIDGEKKYITVILEDQIPVLETIDIGTLTLKDYKMLRSPFRIQLKKEFPELSEDEIDRQVEAIVFTIHSTRRKHVNVFQGKRGLYSQIKSQGSD